MVGTAIFRTATCAAVLLIGGAKAFAMDVVTYDRKLEQAVLKIVAARMGDIRGPLSREWRPPQTDELHDPAIAEPDRPAMPATLDGTPTGMVLRPLSSSIDTVGEQAMTIAPLAADKARPVRVVAMPGHDG